MNKPDHQRAYRQIRLYVWRLKLELLLLRVCARFVKYGIRRREVRSMEVEVSDVRDLAE